MSRQSPEPVRSGLYFALPVDANLCGLKSGESHRKNTSHLLAGIPFFKRYKHYKKNGALWFGGKQAVPGSMKGDKSAVLIFFGELISFIE